MIGGFAIPAWAAAVTDWLNVWGPISWVASGLVGMLVVFISIALWGIYKRSAAVAQYQQAIAQPPRHVNPLRNDFTDEVIELSEFFHPLDKLHAGKTFRRCKIYGPGVMMFTNHMNLFNPRMQMCDLIEVVEGPAFSVVGFERGTFEDCSFFNVTFLITPQMSVMLEEDARRHGRNPPVILRSAPAPR